MNQIPVPKAITDPMSLDGKGSGQADTSVSGYQKNENATSGGPIMCANCGADLTHKASYTSGSGAAYCSVGCMPTTDDSNTATGAQAG